MPAALVASVTVIVEPPATLIALPPKAESITVTAVVPAAVTPAAVGVVMFNAVRPVQAVVLRPVRDTCAIRKVCRLNAGNRRASGVTSNRSTRGYSEYVVVAGTGKRVASRPSLRRTNVSGNEISVAQRTYPNQR